MRARSSPSQFHSTNGIVVLDREDVEEMAAKLNPAGAPAPDTDLGPENVVPIRPADSSFSEASKTSSKPELGEFEKKVLEHATGEIHAPELREDRNVRGWYRVLKELRAQYEKQLKELRAAKKPLEAELSRTSTNWERYRLRSEIRELEEQRVEAGHILFNLNAARTSVASRLASSVHRNRTICSTNAVLLSRYRTASTA